MRLLYASVALPRRLPSSRWSASRLVSFSYATFFLVPFGGRPSPCQAIRASRRSRAVPSVRADAIAGGERAAGTPSVVVSSLPLRNPGEDERDAIIRKSLDVLPRAGAVVRFTCARLPALAGCYRRCEMDAERPG